MEISKTHKEALRDVSNRHQPAPQEESKSAFHDALPLQGAAQLVITGTGFERDEKSVLITKVHELGARYSGALARGRSTHLVCKRLLDAFGSAKYQAALDWGIPIINARWVLDSLEAGQLLPLDDYKTDRLCDTPVVWQRAAWQGPGLLRPQRVPLQHDGAMVATRDAAAVRRASGVAQPSAGAPPKAPSAAGNVRRPTAAAAVEQARSAPEASGVRTLAVVLGMTGRRQSGQPQPQQQAAGMPPAPRLCDDHRPEAQQGVPLAAAAASGHGLGDDQDGDVILGTEVQEFQFNVQGAEGSPDTPASLARYLQSGGFIVDSGDSPEQQQREQSPSWDHDAPHSADSPGVMRGEQAQQGLLQRGAGWHQAQAAAPHGLLRQRLWSSPPQRSEQPCGSSDSWARSPLASPGLEPLPLSPCAQQAASAQDPAQGSPMNASPVSACRHPAEPVNHPLGGSHTSAWGQDGGARIHSAAPMHLRFSTSASGGTPPDSGAELSSSSSSSKRSQVSLTGGSLLLDEAPSPQLPPPIHADCIEPSAPTGSGAQLAIRGAARAGSKTTAAATPGGAGSPGGATAMDASPAAPSAPRGHDSGRRFSEGAHEGSPRHLWQLSDNDDNGVEYADGDRDNGGEAMAISPGGPQPDYYASAAAGVDARQWVQQGSTGEAPARRSGSRLGGSQAHGEQQQQLQRATLLLPDASAEELPEVPGGGLQQPSEERQHVTMRCRQRAYAWLPQEEPQALLPPPAPGGVAAAEEALFAVHALPALPEAADVTPPGALLQPPGPAAPSGIMVAIKAEPVSGSSAGAMPTALRLAAAQLRLPGSNGSSAPGGSGGPPALLSMTPFVPLPGLRPPAAALLTKPAGGGLHSAADAAAGGGAAEAGHKRMLVWDGTDWQAGGSDAPGYAHDTESIEISDSDDADSDFRPSSSAAGCSAVSRLPLLLQGADHITAYLRRVARAMRGEVSDEHVQLIKARSRPPSGTSAAAYHGLRSLTGVVFAEQVSISSLGPLQLNMGDRSRASRCLVLQLPAAGSADATATATASAAAPAPAARQQAGSAGSAVSLSASFGTAAAALESQMTTMVVEPLSIYRLPPPAGSSQPAGSSSSAAAGGTWWLEYRRFFTAADVEAAGLAAGREVQLPEDFQPAAELLRDTEAGHCRLVYVRGEARLMRTRALPHKYKQGRRVLFHRSAFDSQAMLVVADPRQAAAAAAPPGRNVERSAVPAAAAAENGGGAGSVAAQAQQ